MGTDLESLDRKVDSLNKKVDGLISDVARHGDELSRHGDELSRQGVLNEERDGKLNLVLDVVLNINERLAKADDLTSKVKEHDFRIRALELRAANKS